MFKEKTTVVIEAKVNCTASKASLSNIRKIQEQQTEDQGKEKATLAMMPIQRSLGRIFTYLFMQIIAFTLHSMRKKI